jgi:hypothetical protein
MKGWQVNGNLEVEGIRRGLILRYFPSIFLEVLRKATKTKDNWSLGRDLNPGFPEYEAEVLATRPRRSVSLNTVYEFREQWVIMSVCPSTCSVP